ncbi:DNA polymerase III subunit alpha [Halobacillus shinanisalinarum]|uniref:DNA polymerase III subunit alpha n=1 Tax=Halobacillus shinanisalinarum TaxID=2932258 RepID=A0ABY4H115_9BACI|nr:DNA polymerase III subunit alpha [Halobacillus shinanisalinarum]UOQ94123.1 DNA polymerase III subunit alpha [Halobacillus shinanisalinarum]
MSFTHLHVHSGYSLMNSTIQIPSLVRKAKELGFTALALTDDNVMSGAVTFYKTCVEEGIKPLLGMRVHLEYKGETFPIVLLAKNSAGYQKLLSISTMKQTTQDQLSLSDLPKRTDNLAAVITVSDTSWGQSIINGMVDRVEEDLSEWHTYFNDLNLGVKDYGVRVERQLHQPLKEWSSLKGIPVTAMNEVRYLEPSGSDAYYCLRAIDNGEKYALDAHRGSHEYLKAPGEVEDYYTEWWPEVLETNQRIVQSCDVQLDFDQQLIPAFPVPVGRTSDEYLRSLCEQELDSKYSKNKEEAKARLNHELDVIMSMQFSDYFLIVWDFIDYAKKAGMEAGPGRGSAAGSIVSYLLGITQVDPLHYKLFFERFLNPERITMPDIDIDFPDDRRDEVIGYVANKYGSQHVAQICTFGTFASRSVLRELFKTMSVDHSDAAFILKYIKGGSSNTLKQQVQKSEPLKEYVRSSPHLQKVFQMATQLEGLPRHMSTHAAGVVISEEPLVRHTALMQGQNNVYLTQMAMGDIESVGLLKMDFLGLRNLSMMRRIEKKIQNYRNRNFSIETIPLDDESTFELLKQGRTNGVFQLESQGMKGVLQRLRPTHFEDVVAVNALYRPGPMEYIPVYINRKHGVEDIDYPHEDLQPILQSTFGVLVYQEQIMQVAQKLAGYSLGEADLLRRAVSKKQRELLVQQRQQFVTSSIAIGYLENVASELFDWIVKFASYGFNRSHAVAYSVISYQLAYLKAHYPSYFLAELINSTIGDRDKLSTHLREAKDLSAKLKEPSINHSHSYARDEHGSIRLGFLSIKGVGFQAAQAIIEARKEGLFKHLNDFCLRVPSKEVSRSVIESLIMAGAFDELQQNRASLLASIDQAMEQGELFKEFQDQPGLFSSDLDMGGKEVSIEPLPILQQLTMEKEVLGTYLSEHPLEVHRPQLIQKKFITLNDAIRQQQPKSVKAAVVIEQIKEIRTKRGDPMSFLTISDETAEVDAVLFPDVYRGARLWIDSQMLAIIEGKVEERNGRKQWVITTISHFDEQGYENKPSQRLFIKTTISDESKALARLNKLSSYFPGNTAVLLFRSDDRKTYQLGESYSLNVSEECLRKLYEFFGTSSVALR